MRSQECAAVDGGPSCGRRQADAAARLDDEPVAAGFDSLFDLASELDAEPDFDSDLDSDFESDFDSDFADSDEDEDDEDDAERLSVR